MNSRIYVHHLIPALHYERGLKGLDPANRWDTDACEMTVSNELTEAEVERMIINRNVKVSDQEFVDMCHEIGFARQMDHEDYTRKNGEARPFEDLQLDLSAYLE